MMLLEESRSILEAAGYKTKLSNNRDIFYFEDNCLMGFTAIYDSAEALISRWEINQDDFLSENSQRFRIDPYKAWNIYSIHLTDGDANENELISLNKIEEDFRGTRKITVSGIKIKNEIKQTLFPLIPIQSYITLSKFQDIDQLKKRISPEGGSLDGLLDDTPAIEIANKLGDKI